MPTLPTLSKSVVVPSSHDEIYNYVVCDTRLKPCVKICYKKINPDGIIDYFKCMYPSTRRLVL